MNIRIKDICRFGKKSDIKAGEGNTKGKYMFFTSSIDKDKRIDKFDYDEEGIIMGTGGNATLHYYSGKFAVSTDCLVLLPNSSYKCKYLYYFFLHNMRVLEGGFRGAGLKHTSKSYIENIELTKTHSLLEQDKIISVLSNIDNTIVLQNKRLKLLNELTRSLFIEMFGDLFTNPMNWNKQPLGAICNKVIRYPTFYGMEYLETGIKVIRIGNILADGRMDLDDKKYVFVDDIVNKDFPETIIEMNDIIMAVRGDGSAAKRIGIIREPQLVGANISPNLIRIKVDCNKLNPIYMFYYLTGEVGQKYLDVYVNKTAKKNIAAKDIVKVSIYVPPLDLQNRFAEYVSSIDKSKLAVKKSLEELEILKKSLMQKYFA